jgi:CubicO group peptidase (beta-lactamase class C family)
MEADGSWSLDSKRSGFEKLESGVNARGRDFARFGMLFAKEGNWNGERLVSHGWVRESMRADTTTDPSLDYQYFWWVDTPDGKHHFSARGNYGRYIERSNCNIALGGRIYVRVRRHAQCPSSRADILLAMSTGTLSR